MQLVQFYNNKIFKDLAKILKELIHFCARISKDLQGSKLQVVPARIFKYFAKIFKDLGGKAKLTGIWLIVITDCT